MPINGVPDNVVETDHKLEGGVERASGALAKHRWHWTLDETNPNRVGLNAYARAVGKSEKTIRAYAHGYVRWIEAGAGANSRTLVECISRANMSAERAELVEAVAEANQVSFQTARQDYANEVSRLRETVERKVEENPDLAPEDRSHYVRKIAGIQSARRSANSRHREAVAQDRTHVFVTIDSAISKARRYLTEALDAAKNSDLDEDSTEILTESLNRLRALSDLLGMAITGSVDIDWDAELINLT